VAIMNAGHIAVIGTPVALKAKTGKPDASLEEAFIFITGTDFSERGDFRDVRRSRRAERRRG